MNVQHGGKTVYGAGIGILMLETRFPRIPGDIGNALTWPFPVQYRVVGGATPDRVIRQDPRALVDAFIAEGRALVQMGCDGVVTNCGFLSLLQDELTEALEVPVASSALMQVPMVARTLAGNRRVGVLTISKENLSPEHLRAVGVPADTPVAGTDRGRTFSASILGDAPEMDFEACRLDMIDAAHALVRDHDGIGAIVLECTNMVPYARDIRRETGLPVYSIETLVSWLHGALTPRRFGMEIDDPRRVDRG